MQPATRLCRHPHLIESFCAHEKEESFDIISLLDKLPDSVYRAKTSPLDDAMWPWHSEGPEMLAMHMALWAQSGPTRVHPKLVKHPTSHVLRNFYHHRDSARDHWGDTAVGRWLFPALPSKPFSDQARQGQARTETSPTVPPDGGAMHDPLAPAPERGSPTSSPR